MSPHRNVKVNLYQLTISIEQEEVPLTLEVAKQFPMIWNDEEILSKCHSLPTPICKVLKETIADPERDEALLEEQQITWLFLMDMPGGGFAWVAPFTRDGEIVQQEGISSEGRWVDNPDQVKTVILW